MTVVLPPCSVMMMEGAPPATFVSTYSTSDQLRLTLLHPDQGDPVSVLREGDHDRRPVQGDRTTKRQRQRKDGHDNGGGRAAANHCQHHPGDADQDEEGTHNT
jgi:hypothetical protein